MDLEKTTNGIKYSEAILNQDGAGFILFPEKSDTAEMIASAIREIKMNRDVVALRVATEADRDELYRTEIFRHPFVAPLRWYEINADNTKLLRRERRKGTSTVDYIEKYVLPFVAETKERNRQKFGDSIFDR